MSSVNTADQKKKPPTTTEKDAFLWAVIFSIEGEITVNWDAVAARTGMSKGGARNKFNAFKKQNQGIASAGSAPSTAAPATPKKRKAPGAPKTTTSKKAKAKEEAVSGVLVKPDPIEKDPVDGTAQEGVDNDIDDGSSVNFDDQA